MRFLNELLMVSKKVFFFQQKGVKLLGYEQIMAQNSSFFVFLFFFGDPSPGK